MFYLKFTINSEEIVTKKSNLLSWNDIYKIPVAIN